MKDGPVLHRLPDTPERLAEIGAVPSIGTVADSYRSINALAETVTGYYKAEIIYGPTHPGPSKTVEEIATLG